MPESEKKKQWQKENTVFIGVKLQKTTDADILQFLEDKPKQTVIKKAVRYYIASGCDGSEATPLPERKHKPAIVRPTINDIGHKWRYNLMQDYVEIDQHNTNFHPSTGPSDCPKWCKILTLSDGTRYIRYNKKSWVIPEEE